MSRNQNKFFSLNPEVIVNRGVENTLIYNLLNQNKIIVSNDKFPNKKYSSLKVDDCIVSISMLEKLEELDFGHFYNSKHHVEPIITQKDSMMLVNVLNEFKLTRLSIELTSNCSLDCVFCEPGTLGYSSCMCKRWLSEDKMDNNWISVIESAIKLGLEECFICGGDPLLKMEILIPILAYLDRNHIKVIIMTNGSLIDRKICEILFKYNVTISLQVFSDENTNFSKITQKGYFFNNYTNALKLLDEYGIAVIISLIVSSLNENEIKSLQDKFVNFPIQKIYLYPNNKFSSKKYFEEMLSGDSRQFNIDLKSYPFVRNFNNCLSNQISISSEGIVYPCMMLKQFPLGDLNNEELWEIFFEKKHEQFWKLSKRNIQHCKNCELNLTCFDCRAVSIGTSEVIDNNDYCNHQMMEGDDY